MTRLPITLSLFFLITLGVFAQNMDNVETEPNFLSTQTTPVFKGYKNTRGSIYLNDEFQRGAVLIDGQIVATNVGIRYNVNDEQMELHQKMNSASTVANVVRKDESVAVRIGNDMFVYLPSPDKDKRNGYFMVLEEGSKHTLYKKIFKDFIEGKKSANSYSRDVPDTFKEKEALYIVAKDGVLKLVPNSKSKRIKLFAQNEEKIKEYSKEENLNIRNDEDFVQILTYSNSL